MDRIWQWVWDRYGTRYSWAIYAILTLAVLPPYLLQCAIVLAFEKSNQYVAASAVTVAAALLVSTSFIPPGSRHLRLAEHWAAGDNVDRTAALQNTYLCARRAVIRGSCGFILGSAAASLVIAEIAGAAGSRLIQYGVIGANLGLWMSLLAVHSFVEAAVRPARVALAGDSSIGDSLPRSRPSFAVWSNLSVSAMAIAFATGGALVASIVDQASEVPLLGVVIGNGLGFGMAVPLSVTAIFSPSLRPINDLAEGTERVAAGNYSQRLPVVQDDDLGALAASFNRMQAGLAERQRLQAAFGTYVDPTLATKLLEQGDDVFTGERREVTVMFVDIRDFTPFAEANPAEDVVARLNALFEIVVPTVVDAGGHVNKFLGDGALAVFGAPNDLVDHADAALDAAVSIQRLVAKRFDGELRIGIGINTGVVIAGTIGGGSKLEFTLIGDTVNVAARVEQLTKITGDAILITEQSVNALTTRPPGLLDRGSHALKGKSAATQVFGVDVKNLLSK